MLRGKGVEFAAKKAIEILLRQHNAEAWLVEKKSLNPQPNAPDEDITITHKNYPTQSIIVEAKSGALHSFVTGVRTRKERNKKQPHYLVKCHRSRVNYTLASGLAEEKAQKEALEQEISGIASDTKGKKRKESGHGDRYTANDFDLVIANPLNAIFKDVKYTTLQADQELIKILYAHYSVSSQEELLNALDNDWRFVESRDIVGTDGYIEPYPGVWLANDPHWKSLPLLPNVLEQILRLRPTQSEPVREPLDLGGSS